MDPLLFVAALVCAMPLGAVYCHVIAFFGVLIQSLFADSEPRTEHISTCHCVRCCSGDDGKRFHMERSRRTGESK